MKAKHKANLLKLAAYLDTLPDDYERFNMNYYMAELSKRRGLDREIDIHERSKPKCGTVACAVGHGPSAGVRVCKDRSWSDYAERVFGVGVGGIDDEEWAFGYLFDSEWKGHDNTPKGAAARIRTYVALGKPPKGWSYEDPKVMA